MGGGHGGGVSGLGVKGGEEKVEGGTGVRGGGGEVEKVEGQKVLRCSSNACIINACIWDPCIVNACIISACTINTCISIAIILEYSFYGHHPNRRKGSFCGVKD